MTVSGGSTLAISAADWGSSLGQWRCGFGRGDCQRIASDVSQTVRAGKDGVTPMTLAEWVDMQVSDAPHLFEPNAGGGAAGNASGGGASTRASVKNPFRKETWNLTEQMKLQKSDPALAARLKAAA
jgi:hypothetical protein